MTKPRCIETPVVEVTMILKSGFTMKIKANFGPNITGTIERKPFRSETIKQTLKQYELVDRILIKKESCNIVLQVGNYYYADIVSTNRIMLSEGLYLVGSKFGRMLSGRTKHEYTAPKRDSLMMLTYSLSEISTNFLGFNKTDDSIFNSSWLEDFWALETVEIKDPSTIADDSKAFLKFNKSIQLVNGRYQVGWLWREENPNLFNNYKLSYGRLASTVNRLKENPETMKQYSNIIEGHVEKGIIEKIE